MMLTFCLCLGCTDKKLIKYSETSIVILNEIQRKWADVEIGVLIHFDIPIQIRI